MFSVTACLQHCMDLLCASERRRRAAGAEGPASAPSLANAWAAGAGLGDPFPGSGSGMFGSLGSSLFGSSGVGSGGGSLSMGGSGLVGKQPKGGSAGSGSLLMGPTNGWGSGNLFVDGAAPAGRPPMGCDASIGGSSLLVGGSNLASGALGGALAGWGAAAGCGSGALGTTGWGGSAGVAGGIGSMAVLGGPMGGLQRAGGSMGSGALAGLAAAPEAGAWLQSMGGSLGSGAFAALTADAGGLGAGLQRTGGSLGSGALASLAPLPAAPDAGGLGPGFGQGAGCGLQCAGGSWGSGSLAALVALAAGSPRRDPELKIEGLITAPPRGAQLRLLPRPLCTDADGKLRASAPDDGGGLSPGSRLAGYQALEARLAGLVSVGSGLSGTPWWLEAAASPRKASRLGPGEASLAAAAPRGAFLNPPTAGQVRCAVHCSAAMPEMAHKLAPMDGSSASIANMFDSRNLAGALCQARSRCSKCCEN